MRAAACWPGHAGRTHRQRQLRAFLSASEGGTSATSKSAHNSVLYTIISAFFIYFFFPQAIFRTILGENHPL